MSGRQKHKATLTVALLVAFKVVQSRPAEGSLGGPTGGPDDELPGEEDEGVEEEGDVSVGVDEDDGEEGEDEGRDVDLNDLVSFDTIV